MFNVGFDMKKLTPFIIAISLSIFAFGDAEETKDSIRILKESRYIQFINIAAFTDGGSVSYTFLNDSGEVIHIWEDGSLSTRTIPRRFYLKVRYDEKNPIEIKQGSELEKRILVLIKESSKYGQLFPQSPHTFESLRDGLMNELKTRKGEGIKPPKKK